MYTVDDLDEVVALDAPHSNIGAPLPLILADDSTAVLAYYLEDTPPHWDGSSIRVMTHESVDQFAIVVFRGVWSQMLGAPNDEAFDGHPLAARGLGPYRPFVVRNSSWVRALERMNSRHEFHDGPRFLREHVHYVFAFHDSTFECVARGIRWSVNHGSLEAALPMMQEELERGFEEWS